IVAVYAGTRRERGVLLAVGTIALTFPIVISMLHPPPIYTTWQGRHGLPLWVGVPIIAGTVAATTCRARVPSTALVIVFAGLLGAEQISAFATAAHRYAVGASGRVLYFVRPRWSGPVAPAVLLTFVVILSA